MFCCRSILVCAGPPWPCWPHSATNSPACPRPLWRTQPSAKDSTPGRNVSQETIVLLNPVGINVPQVCRQDNCQEVHHPQWRHFLVDLLIVIIINNNQLHPVLATVSSYFIFKIERNFNLFSSYIRIIFPWTFAKSYKFFSRICVLIIFPNYIQLTNLEYTSIYLANQLYSHNHLTLGSWAILLYFHSK